MAKTETCRVCGEAIRRRREDGPRPWLHVDGMSYEVRGIPPHKAEPAE
jgi:hypothetical protein